MCIHFDGLFKLRVMKMIVATLLETGDVSNANSHNTSFLCSSIFRGDDFEEKIDLSDIPTQ